VLSPAIYYVGVVAYYDEKVFLFHLYSYLVIKAIIVLLKYIVNMSSVYKLWISNYIHIGISEHVLFLIVELQTYYFAFIY